MRMPFAQIALIVLVLSVFSLPASAVQIYGHRGAAGLSPENSIPAYKTALQLGVDVIDMDVTMTKDGVVVVTHDLTLNPAITRDSKGKWIRDSKLAIKQMTFPELELYDIGRIHARTFYAMRLPDQVGQDNVHIPSLKQVLDYGKKVTQNRMRYQIELKTDVKHPEISIPPKKFAAAVLDVVKKAGVADKVELQSFDWRTLVAARKLDPKIKTSFLTHKGWFGSTGATSMAGIKPKNYHNSIPKMIHAVG